MHLYMNLVPTGHRGRNAVGGFLILRQDSSGRQSGTYFGICSFTESGQLARPTALGALLMQEPRSQATKAATQQLIKKKLEFLKGI